MKNRYYLYFLWIFLPLVTALRTWQLAVAVDDVGFYRDPYITLSNALGYIVLGVVLVLLVVGRYFLKEHPVTVPPKKNLPLGIAAVVLAISCIPQGISDFAGATSSFQQMLTIISIGLLAASYTAIGASFTKGTPVPFWVTVLPVLSQFVRVVLNYTHFNGIAQISENVIFILFLSAFLAFSLAHCRVFSGVDSKKGLAWCYGTGACTALFGLLTSVPHWIMGQNQYPLSALGFGAAIYAVVFISIMGLAKPEKQEQLVPEETPDETAIQEIADEPLPCEPIKEEQPAPEVKETDADKVFEDIRNLLEK